MKLNSIFTILFFSLFFFSCNNSDDSKKVVEIPEPEIEEWHDTEFEMSEEDVIACEECQAALSIEGYENCDNLYLYFMDYVYDPAIEMNKLSPGNKTFLDQLKTFLLCTGDSCNADDIIRPVYKLEGENLVRIFSDDYGYVYDTVLTSLDKQMSYYVYYSNSSAVEKKRMRYYKSYRDECNSHHSYVLEEVKSSNIKKPAFCSPFNLDLEFISDPVADSILWEMKSCDDICLFCGGGDDQITFAKLKNVPNLLFTTDIGEEGAVVPSRGIYINVENKFLIQLWRYNLEMGGCACI